MHSVLGLSRLLVGKLVELQSMILSFLQRKKETLHEFQELLGWVVVPGRAFCVHLYTATSKISTPCLIHITKELKEGLKAWKQF